MAEKDLKAFLRFATHLAFEGGKVLEKYWGQPTEVYEKGFSWNLVTDADKESEAVILDLIQKEYPGHSILSEEFGERAVRDSSLTWIIDPLDGTTNYTHQYPMVSVSVALAEKGRPIVGVVYNPILKELFQAVHGQGCSMNGHLVHVSKVDSLEKSLLATGFAYDRKETQDNNYAEFCHMTQICQGVRRGGSAALDLAYVAAGKFDGYWERGLKPWDIAAGIVLIEEAGGKVSSYEGEPLILESGRILTTNGLIHDKLLHGLKVARTAS